MAKRNNNDYSLPASILLILGGVDLLRGFLHTYAIVWAANTFAKLDLSVARNDQLVLLGAFGISNFLTGMLYILISRKAPQLSHYVLALIPAAYLTGFIGLKLSGISANAEFEGRYFMLVYLAVCVITLVIFLTARSHRKH